MHARIYDNPKGKWFRAGQYPPLSVTGSLPDHTPELAYSERLTINNAVGDCSVQLISSTNWPPGGTLTVDQDTDEVIVAWPAYAVIATAETSITNPGFESGDADWSKGLGFRIGSYTWDYGDGEEVQAYAGTKSAEYAKGHRGNSRVMSGQPRLCDPTTIVTGTCQIQQGPSKVNNTGGWALLQFLDTDGLVISEHTGNAVNSSNDGAWHQSIVTATAPTGTVYALLGAECYRKKENKPMWVDTFAWNLEPAVTEHVGINEYIDVTITLRVTDSAGRTADWTGTIASVASEQEIAAALLADLDHWWTFDNDLLDSVGSVDLTVNSTGPTYQAGKKGQEVLAGSATIGANGSDLTTATDHSFWGWVNVIGAGANRLLFGVSHQALGIGGYSQYMYIGTNGTVAGANINPGGGNPTVGVTGTVAPGSRYFLRCNVDATAKTVELFVNEVSQGVSSAAVNIIDCNYFGLHDVSTGSDTTAICDALDEAGFIQTRKTTIDEGEYLYAAGAGKSYANVVADAAP